MNTEYVKFALGIVLASSLVLVGWLAHSWYSDSVKLAIEEVKDEVSASTAKAIADIKIENKTITNKTIEHFKTETVYKDCVADDEMMKLINHALTGK